jgi:hypothetical protein
MRSILTYSEYLKFKQRYYCVTVPDEECTFPIEVETLRGKSTWTVYVSGEHFHEALDWLEAQRARQALQDAFAAKRPAVKVPPEHIVFR